MKILNVVGARPNFIKIAPIMREMLRSNRLSPLLLHTGQHYDSNMNAVFFDQLEIPKPDFDLEVGSGSNPEQVSKIMGRFEAVLNQARPAAILVVGDVNSTIACALVGAYHKIPVIHVEAGLRSYDRDMPEEVNRVLTDQISELLFTTEPDAEHNLIREGVDPKKIHLVGNVMVDTLLKNREIAERNSDALETLQLEKNRYAVLTLHRPSNVDDESALKSILNAVKQLSQEIKVVFPIHPRTEKRIEEAKLQRLTETCVCVPPLPYLDMLHLMANAKMVLTDSGGMQEETTLLNVPCLTLRTNTERPITLTQGTNTIVGTENSVILAEARRILKTGGKKGKHYELWDGRAAERIVKIIRSHPFSGNK